jgi:predicted CXXCH cytochrome family protein
MERPNRTAWLLLTLPLLSPLAVLLALRFGHDPVAFEAALPLIHREDGFAGSWACRPCHPDHHDSWSRTFHRTMTQRPEPGAVRGAFDGRAVTYEGREARPFRRGERFFFELPAEGGGARVAEVALVVGSRRYQQYFERVEMEDGIAFRRLPFLWHIEARRWLHLNTVFLAPDNPDWDKHRTLWNDNCIFCHNTGPRPGERFRWPAAGERRFDPHVAELGIACETCHGPGRRHAERYRGMAARYAAYDAEAGHDVVDPKDLDRERAISLCGQCHGQRIAFDLRSLVGWLREGPTFRSGDRLADHAVPLARDTPSPAPHLPDLFRQRFWADGTPRLTAYEYQGVTMSPCYQRGALTCSSCHEMHGGDPRGMVEPEMRGDAACLQCHGDLGRDLGAHTKHKPEGTGSRCLSCHMPQAVYGVLEVHRSHRIENPDPRRDGEAGRPHACTTCHFDRSLAWSAREMTRMWGRPYGPPAFRADGAPVETADGLASLLSGDAVQRIVYAWAAGWPDSAVAPADKATMRAALIVTLGDAYPSIRWMAQRSLLRLEDEMLLGLGPALRDWDHTDREARLAFETLFPILAREGPARLAPPPPGGLLGPDFTPDRPAFVALLRLQADHVIDIGE